MTREIQSWLMDMDGVLVREQQAIPGASEFLIRLQAREDLLGAGDGLLLGHEHPVHVHQPRADLATGHVA